MESPNLTGWLIKIINVEEIFERTNHWANKAIPITARTEVMKGKSCGGATPQMAIMTVTSIIKKNKLINFKIGLTLYLE
jgi:hypothetical protein